MWDEKYGEKLPADKAELDIDDLDGILGLGKEIDALEEAMDREKQADLHTLKDINHWADLPEPMEGE